ncbi:hypothetical protein [Viridibacillus arvi]|uniref:hypothetical protein n=1 Tax=Viridibacillus arvi TaxID=263475 RepID=UPI0034CEDFAA
MDITLHEKYKHVHFTDEQCDLFATLLDTEPLHKEVMYFIVSEFLNNTPATIKSITENIRVERKVGVKNKRKTSIIKFDVQMDFISRKMAESIVKQLAFSSLVFVEMLAPYKFIKPTTRGAEVCMLLQERDNQRAVDLPSNGESVKE